MALAVLVIFCVRKTTVGCRRRAVCKCFVVLLASTELGSQNGMAILNYILGILLFAVA